MGQGYSHINIKDNPDSKNKNAAVLIEPIGSWHLVIGLLLDWPFAKIVYRKAFHIY